jgi:hypothetical protein
VANSQIEEMSTNHTGIVTVLSKLKRGFIPPQRRLYVDGHHAIDLSPGSPRLRMFATTQYSRLLHFEVPFEKAGR